MPYYTFHDATVDGHKRITIASWDNEDDVDGRFGPQIEPPAFVTQWKRYDAGAHTDCTFETVSEFGD